MRTFVFIFCSIICAFNCDKFDSLDADHDGKLDRSEFSKFASDLKSAVAPFVDVESIAESHDSNSLNIYDIFGSQTDEGVISGAINALVVILITEIGDKTFFIAAVLAMRNGRLIVYLGCMAALGVMHVLSALLGYALPALLPRVYTHYASALLFVYFGVKLLKDAMEMEGTGPSEELQEVENELIAKRKDDEPDDPERGHSQTEPQTSNLLRVVNVETQVFTQAFTLTFLAEWGDRSQIATIAIASTKSVLGVIVGGLIGHALCTGLAVLGGRMLAAKISERTVAFSGGTLFLVFAVHSFIVGP